MKTRCSGAALAALTVLLGLAPGCRRTVAPRAVVQAAYVRVVRAQGALPRDNPTSELWELAPEFQGTLAPQNISPPILQTPGVNRVRVRALHDGNWIAFRLEWEDSTKDDTVGLDHFSDAAAVQLPTARGAPPSPMMGHPSGPVRILYWKAAWQTEDPMAVLHPNRPPATPYPYEAAQDQQRAALEPQYAPARYVRNPNLVRPANGPVFVGEAEGFGSLSPGRSEAAGRGVHRNGRWFTVVAMPMGDHGTSPLAVGQDSSVAFAVWEGHAQNAGGRKMRSESWVRLAVEGG